MRVLIIEDGLVAAIQSRSACEKAGHSVEVAHTLTDGLKLLDGHFDAVILDLNLPDSDGINTLKRFVQESYLPVVVLTASEEKELRHECLRHGAMRVLWKDTIETADVAGTVEDAVAGSRFKLPVEK